MVERYRDGVVPDAEPDPVLNEGDDALDGIDGVVRELLDRAELTQALEAIWSRVRRLNRYVEETQALGAGEGRRAGDAPGPGPLLTWPRACGFWRSLLHPYMPETSGRLLECLVEGNRELDAFGARGGGQRISRGEPLFPKLRA